MELNSIFSGRKGKALVRSMPARLGYVFQIFTSKMGGLSSEVEILRDADNARGWQNKLNFGRGEKIEKLFDKLCPVVLPAIRFPSAGGWKLKPSVRRIDFDVLNELLGIIELEVEELQELSFEEKLKFCRRKWVLEHVDVLADRFEEQAQNGWEFNRSENSASSRLYHPLLSVPREVRSAVLVRLGYTYQMDIKSCHPVLLLQAYDRVLAGVEASALPELRAGRSEGLDRPLVALRELAGDPDAFRRSVATAAAGAAGLEDVCDVLPVVKLALSALLHDTDRLPVFDGPASWLKQAARTDCRAVVRCWLALGGAPGACFAAYEAFRTNEKVRDLIRDYRWMRGLLVPLMAHRMGRMEGRIQVAEWLGVEDIEILPHVFQSKNPIYFLAELMEKRVRDVLVGMESNVFLVHDAVVFRSYKSPQIADLRIRSETGLHVKLTGEYLIG